MNYFEGHDFNRGNLNLSIDKPDWLNWEESEPKVSASIATDISEIVSIVEYIIVFFKRFGRANYEGGIRLVKEGRAFTNV